MSRSRSIVLTLAAASLAACAAPAAAPPVGQSAPAGVRAELISEAEVYARMNFLASDELRGRDTPSPGLEAAAAYLASEARRFGLEPAGQDGTFFQRWPFPLRRVSVDAARLSIATPRGTQTLQYGRDYYSSGGTPSELSAGLVFAGQDFDGNGADAGLLRDRIAVFALPGSMNRNWRMLRNRQAAQAQAAGALASIHVLDPAIGADLIGRMAEQAGRPMRTMGAEVGYPQLFISHAAAQRLFDAADLQLDQAWGSAVASDARPVALAGVTATAGIRVEELEQSYPPNVVAILPGSDPTLRDEYVLLTAHVDHVGVGRPDARGDSIYNGADDNSSGTIGLLQIAKALAEAPERPRRSVVFLWVSGEEKGLLGSRWFSDNPTFPLERVVASINADMIGSDRHRDSVVVIGKEYSTLGETVDGVNARYPELRLITSDDIWPEQQFFYRSDHVNFLRKDIPSLFFFTGVHECYHQPCDTPDFVDSGKVARVATLIHHTVVEIANADGRPEWDPAGLEEVRRLTR